MLPWWALALGVVGINLSLWGLIGLLRYLDGPGRWWQQSRSPSCRARIIVAQHEKRIRPGAKFRLSVDDVAVLIAAHNEETVIVDSLRAITALVPARNVHVVSDGSTDRTVEFAMSTGVQVMSTAANVGKAGALQEAIRDFSLAERFEVVMFLDADTHVESGYFESALPLFGDPHVVAVAGCVRAVWEGRELSPVGKLLAFHRQRIYSMTQYLLKFGQTWRRVNATHIVPGFASLYRTSVLPMIEVNPPGLVIEDFNMTFEVYQKQLGKVGFTPNAIAKTQDPGTLRDYVRQCKRWSLGLWQTVRRHPPRANLFSVMLAMLLLELLTSSLMMLGLPFVALIVLVPYVVTALHAVPGVTELHNGIVAVVSPDVLLTGVLLPDLAVTCAVAIFLRQPRMLVCGCFFLPLRVLDAAVALYALPLCWWSNSTGQWRSPRRHAVAAEDTRPGSRAG